MGHKKSKVLLALFLIAILVPLTSLVNQLQQVAPSDAASPIRMADGNPGPPFPPPPTDLGMQGSAQPVIVADGNPGPPIPPPTGLGQVANEYTA